MALSDVVGCVPWRQSSAREFTPFEWAVVQTALARGMDQTSFGVGLAESGLVRQAMQMQTCPAWRSTWFSPAPAVSTYLFKCFGAWYAQFAPTDRAKIRQDILGGLLCSQNPPWADCPSASRYAGPAELWEGGPQIAPGASFLTGCDGIRHRTYYAPIKGKDLLKMVQYVGAPMPAWLGLAPPSLLEREFLLGVQAKESVNPAIFFPQATPGMQTSEPTAAQIALATLDELAIIWAPGKGASVLPVLAQPLDPTKLGALLSQMAPDLMGQIDFGQVAGPVMTSIFSAATQVATQIFGQAAPAPFHGPSGPDGQPGTPPSTGFALLDQTESKIGGTDPPLPSYLERVKSVSPWLVVGVVVVAVAVVAYAARRA